MISKSIGLSALCGTGLFHKCFKALEELLVESMVSSS